MDRSFSEDEKRFMLAEMIKTSRLDIETLAMFVKANQVRPDWMSMQIPLGRNMNQCIEVAESMSIYGPSLKRSPLRSSPDQAPKRLATSERPEFREHQPVNLPHPPPPSHVPILPRPVSSWKPNPRPTVPEIPRKRGRPSRADKAKRQLRPILPLPGSEASLPNGTPPGAPRPILPAPLSRPATASRPMTPPEAYVPASRASESPPIRKRERSL